ncbi:hypothetical protein BC940DRAFT_343964 [Gongronella butleri]|nr:hypothetical protein BC940DRAFT_343964 [Gongronella butleri]
MFNIAPFITKYVRSLHATDDHIEPPYSKTQFGVVLMADVVGFSKLTTFANERGDSSPEAIASEIGDYMGECIQIIEFYGGDVVKFLGDAVLVCFQDLPQADRRSSTESSSGDEEHAEMSERRKNVLLRQAMECGLQLLVRQSHFRVYLTAEEIMRHRLSDGSIQRHHVRTKGHGTSVLASSLYAEHSDDNRPREIVHQNLKSRLPLRIGSTSSMMTPIQLASPSRSTRSSVSTERTAPNSLFQQKSNDRKTSSTGQSLMDTLNPFRRRDSSSDSLWNKISDKRRGSSVSSGRQSSDEGNASTKDITSIDLELHIALSCGNVTNLILGDADPPDNLAKVALITQQPELPTPPANPFNDEKDGYFLRYHGRLEYAIGGEAVDSLSDALDAATAGEISLTPAAFDLVNQQQLITGLPVEMRNGYYVIKGFDWMDRKGGKGNRRLAHPQVEYLKDKPGLMNQASQLKIEPLIPKVRDTTHFALDQDARLQYYKYLNRCSLYRLTESIKKGTFPAQVRDVTIMFVSLGKINVATPKGVQIAQNALKEAINLVVKYEGILQQFAIDDKGATILCVFGLPPLSHENEPLFAAKAAVKLRNAFERKFSKLDYAISLSSGSIFYAVMPQDSPYRRDAAIAGDAIVVAVRMLKFPFAKHNIVCDLNTKKQIGWRCEFQDFGSHAVKGKKAPMPIYGLKKFSTARERHVSLSTADPKKQFIGYKPEMDRAAHFMDDWVIQPNHHLLVVTGASGSGKSMFCLSLQSRYEDINNFSSCWIVTTEVERSTKYFMLKNLIFAVLDMLDSDDIPPMQVEDDHLQHPMDDTRNSSDMSTQRLSALLMGDELDKAENMDSIQNSSSSERPALTTSMTSGKMNLQETASTREGPRPIRSMSVRSAMSSFSSGSNVNRFAQKETNTALMSQVQRCLAKCNEKDAMLPLFKDLNIGLNDLEENKYTKKLDSRGRDILLSGLILRMVMHASQFKSLMFVCDDMQWADHASVRLLYLIHEECPKVLLVFASRLAGDYDISFIDDFYKIGKHAGITLNGLDTLEIADLILNIFGPSVKHVDPSIKNVIQQRTKGNPLYVTNLAIVMRDFDQVTVEGNLLKPANKQVDLENFLGEVDYGRIIKMQYDRLNSNYQEFLTVASCLDQYFTIYEVGAAIQQSNTIFQHTDLKLVQNLIARYDTYHFLKHTGSSQSASVDENQTSDADPSPAPSITPPAPTPTPSQQPSDHMVLRRDAAANGNAAEYSFLHDTIPKAIYEMVSYEHRIGLHRKLAHYYEQCLTSENQAQILGKVTRHYLATDDRRKQIYYLEELASLNMRSYLLLEATEQLHKIIDILMQNDDLANNFGRLHFCDIYYRLGVCYTMRTDLDEGEKYLFIALRCLDNDLPSTDRRVLFKIWTNTFKQYKHRHWPRLLCKMTEAKQKPEIGRRIIDIMRQLSNIYVYTGNMVNFAYTSLVGVNTCESLGNAGPNYTLFLARYALVCWLDEKRGHSIYYLSRALTHITHDFDSDTLSVCAYLCFAAGKFKDTRMVAYQAIKGATTFGVVTDFQAFYRAVGMLITTWIFEGTLDMQLQDRQLLDVMYYAARSNKDEDAIAWVRVYRLSNAIITNQLDSSADLVKRLESDIGNNVSYRAIAISGVLFCYYTRQRAYDRAFGFYQIFMSVLPSLTVTPNIFPNYGLVFATMALYMLLEDSENDIITIDGRTTIEQFTTDMAKLNSVLQQVKIWEFMEPCLYLARAYPYIATGRIVEGYMVLRHGTFEMKFIHEIRFLKAYYCSILGKYAFSPIDRVEWTDIARKELEMININADVYCNPDPPSLYNICTPADCTNISVHCDFINV